MYVPFHANGIISQFEGYEALEEFPWEHYRKQYGNISRLDRILEAEGGTPNRYKASKQADVLTLFYLFSSEELAELFERLGYSFEYETIPRNVEYCARRTTHGSTLSRVVASWVLARRDRTRSWKLFQEALRSDLEDIQNGTTPERVFIWGHGRDSGLHPALLYWPRNARGCALVEPWSARRLGRAYDDGSLPRTRTRSALYPRRRQCLGTRVQCDIHQDRHA